ncbi:MAG: hypothetical protein HKN23_00930 [Verrucomicrobiales bacterium]|nr:hypothetical protein [Verrucomicrobiales bacterium]
MSEFAQFRLLLRVHLRMVLVKFTTMARRSRLMTATLIGFLVTYSVTAFWLFRRGLEYLGKLPAAGSLLGDRLIYVIFFCFTVMLLFSVAVTGYIAMFRSRDTRWLLTLPISHRVLFLWKSLESAAFSSWGMIFILAPMLLAFAIQREAHLTFYLKTLLALFPFLIVAGSVGALVLITAVRFLNRRQIAIVATVGLLAAIGLGMKSVQDDKKITENTGLSAALTFQRVLHHTNLAVNRVLPSTWLAESVVTWSRPYQQFRNALYPSLLGSYALMGILAVGWAGHRWFYPAWNASVQASARAALRRQIRAEADSGPDGIARGIPKPALLRHLIGRALAAISRKDVLSFIREPGQWIQFAVVFGLLGIYASGLRSMNDNLDQPRDLYLVAYLNLSVCALALSTLTTRFVFPQFSLEGRRLWILAMSPLKLQRLVLQKFVMSALFTGLAVTAILVMSGNNLDLGTTDTLFFTTAVILLALGLNAVAVGFGVLFPNLEETNTAKIVSGFGGTLCLVTSFVYIVTFLLLLAWARFEVFRSNQMPEGLFDNQYARLGCGLALTLTFLVTTLPLSFAMRRLKKLEILGNL